MAIIAVVCLVVPIVLIRSAMRNARESIAGAGEAVVSSARSIAEAFRTGTIEMTFRSYATDIKGVSRLQFAELRQMESFERKDSASVAWGTIPLPDVVVEARGQVVYVYTLDLQKHWAIRVDGKQVDVTAPAPEFNLPALDPSTLAIETKRGSMLRDETAVKEALRTGLSSLLHERARANLSLVRETGRKATEDFVRGFLLAHYDDARGLPVRVRFADEAPASTSPPLAIEGVKR
jgi:hypothetical protein